MFRRAVEDGKSHSLHDVVLAENTYWAYGNDVSPVVKTWGHFTELQNSGTAT